MKESSTNTAPQVWVKKLNMPQLVRESSKTTEDYDDASLFLPPPASRPSRLQRWVSGSKMSFDSSPAPLMSGLRRWASSEEDRRSQYTMDNKQRSTPLSRPSPCSYAEEDDADDCPRMTSSPQSLLQRWDSSSGSEGSFDECPAPPSSSLRRWATENCGAAYSKSAPLLPAVESKFETAPDEQEPSDFFRVLPTRRFEERWASGSASEYSLDGSAAAAAAPPMSRLRRR